MSTNRYTNAGPVGTGTTTENMQSRAKAWFLAQTSQAGATLSFNVSGVVDSGVGYWTVNLIATFASGMSPCTSGGANPGLMCSAYANAANVPTRVFNTAGAAVDEWAQFAAYGPLA